tara:strand:+ start:348 stop:950 length:603 start_codon:yes stop_codon:yes gene_type:complete
MIQIDATKDYLDWSKINIDDEKVVIIDGLFPPWFINYVHRQVMDASGWRFGHYTSIRPGMQEREIPAFSQRIFPEAQSPLSNDSLFPMIYYAVTDTMTWNSQIGEILINGQQPFHNTVYHQDCKDNGLTMLYYVNADSQESWGGETCIKVGGDIIEVAPKPGRISLFLGRLDHKGKSFNDVTHADKSLRATIAYKIGRDD